MKASARTGLVRLEFTEPFRNYQPGTVASFSIREAKKLVEAKVAKEAKASGDTIDAPTDDAPAPVRVPKPVHRAIPEDWESQHVLSQMRIAREISGSNVNVSTKAEAAKVIRDELKRRGKAEEGRKAE